MPETKPNQTTHRIDALMEQASTALVARQYFQTERLCLDALEQAFRAADFNRMARIILPLQEARRQKRDIAVETNKVYLVDSVVPNPGEIKPGMYLIKPPRVGLDGRLLREAADREEIPVLIVVREPTTRAGLCPVVALGPVTVRARVPEFVPPIKPQAKSAKASDAKGKKTVKGKSAEPPADEKPATILPDAAWMLAASEALGDASIAEIDPARPVVSRVEELYMRLQGIPDHEKLHQALRATCEEAARLGPAALKRRAELADDEFEDDLDDQPESDDEV
ncbi:MAG: hypothetical protein IBJ18_10295 [Phycisphaerales bacterium]|nr:hypothetical protein [Phycisphaerales bacterium]